MPHLHLDTLIHHTVPLAVLKNIGIVVVCENRLIGNIPHIPTGQVVLVTVSSAVTAADVVHRLGIAVTKQGHNIQTSILVRQLRVFPVRLQI